MIVKKNIVIPGQHQKPILVDVFHTETTILKPILIFCHGYKGFKDWGAWDMMANQFARAGYCFVKFNFSHNGGAVEEPIDFPDLEAFGQNNYSIELDDLNSVINWACEQRNIKTKVDIDHIGLIGHSRGGGIVTLKAAEDSRIKVLITLAGVSDFKARFPKGSAFEAWKEEGVYYVENGRTHQQMPHYFQFYEDFAKNEERLNIKRAASQLNIPHLIIHGNKDTSVSVEEAKALHQWNLKSELVIIEGANHVFGTSHPWQKDTLPLEFERAINVMLDFLEK